MIRDNITKRYCRIVAVQSLVLATVLIVIAFEKYSNEKFIPTVILTTFILALLIDSYVFGFGSLGSDNNE